MNEPPLTRNVLFEKIYYPTIIEERDDLYKFMDLIGREKITESEEKVLRKGFNDCGFGYFEIKFLFYEIRIRGHRLLIFKLKEGRFGIDADNYEGGKSYCFSVKGIDNLKNNLSFFCGLI